MGGFGLHPCGESLANFAVAGIRSSIQKSEEYTATDIFADIPKKLNKF
jgi:hypothetical protein